LVVLGIKYGTHGDDAHISVAVGGEFVLRFELADLFR
jgi:hypothetical protein